MSLLSRYYVKQSVQRRFEEENSMQDEMANDSVISMYREVNNLRENLIIYSNHPESAATGFFGL